jgi:NAD(P)-dependent dehydrogenase (short-subunit alcohol dehydrogenase family)
MHSRRPAAPLYFTGEAARATIEEATMAYKGLDVSGKVVLVTGGTSGIGRAIALGFAQAGAKVCAGSTNPDKVAAIAKELGQGHHAVQMDVSNEASVKSAVDETAKKFGRLDVVVNAAGVIMRKPSLELATEDFERIVRVNLTGSFVVCREAARVMKEQSPQGSKGERGNIVLIASLNSFISLSEVLAYACSKSGVLGLIRGLANEWGPIGVRVNGIAPGVIPTDLNRPLIEGTPRGAALKGHTTLGRFGDADELVGAAIYLASPSASYVTGETIIVDGGFLAKGV